MAATRLRLTPWLLGVGASTRLEQLVERFSPTPTAVSRVACEALER